MTVTDNKFILGTSDAEIKAVFERVYTVTVAPAASGSGTAAANPASGTAGTEVTLTATPAEGWQFKEWQVVSGGVTVTDNKFILGTSDAEIKAVFEKLPAYTVTVTFSVLNGYWNDHTREDKTVVLTGDDKSQLKLSADQIPAAGSLPDEFFQEGGWDVVPNTSIEITEDTVYTYVYDEEHSVRVSWTIAFSVINGTWNDGTRDNKTVILTGLKGDVLTLAANQIPAVGGKPDEGYTAGAWDPVPDTNTEITADTSYTYTFIPKDYHYFCESGENQEYVKMSGKDAEFVIKRSVDDNLSWPRFKSAELDGNTILPQNYSAAAGSVVICLKSAWLDTVEIGGHSLTVRFSDGSVDIPFKVLKSVPKTGDSASPVLWIVMVALGLLGLAAVLWGINKEKKKRRKKDSPK